jgi:hypothetical protein
MVSLHIFIGIAVSGFQHHSIKFSPKKALIKIEWITHIAEDER